MAFIISVISSFGALVGYDIAALNAVESSKRISEFSEKLENILGNLLDENLYAGEPLSSFYLTLDLMEASEAKEPKKALRRTLVNDVAYRYDAMEVYCESLRKTRFKEACDQTLNKASRLLNELGSEAL